MSWVKLTLVDRTPLHVPSGGFAFAPAKIVTDGKNIFLKEDGARHNDNVKIIDGCYVYIAGSILPVLETEAEIRDLLGLRP